MAFFIFKPATQTTQAVTGSETMTRTIPSSVAPSATFTVTYTAVGASGQWGATILEDATSCTPAHKETLFIHDTGDADTKSVTYTAPASGSCVFTGNYQFGDKTIKNFASATVNICSNECSTSGAKECSGAGFRTCGNYDADSCLEWSTVTTCQYGCTGGVCNSCTPVCTRPSDLCVDASTVANGCSGFCTGSWIVNKNTNADIDCSGAISTSELQSYGQQWLLGSVTRIQIGQVIQAWALV